MRKLIIKSVVALLVLLVILSLSKFYPSIGASFAVNQLQDTYTSTTGIKFWNAFKKSQYIIYFLFLVALFFNEIRSIFTRGNSNK